MVHGPTNRSSSRLFTLPLSLFLSFPLSFISHRSWCTHIHTHTFGEDLLACVLVQELRHKELILV